MSRKQRGWLVGALGLPTFLGLMFIAGATLGVRDAVTLLGGCAIGGILLLLIYWIDEGL